MPKRSNDNAEPKQKKQDVYYYSLYSDGSDLVENKYLVNKISKRREGTFINVDGASVRIYSSKSRFNNQLYYQGKQITDVNVLKTFSEQAYGKSVVPFIIINGHKVRVCTRETLMRPLFYADGSQITDLKILCSQFFTHLRSLTYFVDIDENNKNVTVFTKKQIKEKTGSWPSFINVFGKENESLIENQAHTPYKRSKTSSSHVEFSLLNNSNDNAATVTQNEKPNKGSIKFLLNSD